MPIRTNFTAFAAIVLCSVAGAFPSGAAEVGGGLLAAHDDLTREILRSAAPSFLEGSPGRDLPMDVSYATFRFEIWPKVAEKCRAFDAEHKGTLATPDLVAIAADAGEDPRAREMALWLLAARVTKKEDGGRPASAQQLLPFNSEGTPRLADSLASYLVSSDRVTRYSATAVVGAHGAADSADALVRAIKGPFLPERHAACRAIGRFGLEGLGVEGLGLLRTVVYSHHDIGTTLAATHSLLLVGTLEFEQHGKTTAIDELVKALRYAPHAGEPRYRKDFGSWPPGQDYVVGFTEEEIASGARADAFIRYCAAVALAHVDVHELQRHVAPAMLEALGDNEVAVVDQAFNFVQRVGVRMADWGAAPVLESLVRAPDPMLSSRAAWAFAQWGERMADQVPLLIERTDELITERGDLFFPIWTLGNSGDARAEAHLLRLRERIGPQTRPRDEEGNEVDTDQRWIKMVDEAIARIRQVQTIRNSTDGDEQEKALTEALKQYRRRYLAPTLMEVVKDPKRGEEMRVRCAAALRDIEPVAAPVWFSEMAAAQAEIPAKLRGVLEQGRPARKEDEE